MKKSFFSIRDEIAKNSLDAIASLSAPEAVIVGGMAVQLHGHETKTLLRNTPDIDLVTKDNMSYDTFLGSIFPNHSKFLKARGYHVQPKKGRNNNAVKVIRNPNHSDEQSFLLNFTVFSPNIYGVFLDYLNQQIDCATPIIYDSARAPVKVAALEEVIPLKLQRAVRYGVDREALVGPVYPSLIEHAKRGNWGHLAGMPIGEWMATIDRMQAQLLDDNSDSERVGTYKLSKDIYDLCFAARIISDTISSFDKDRYEANIRRILDRPKDSMEVH